MNIGNKNIIALLFGMVLLSVLGLVEIRQLQTNDAVSPDLERLVNLHPENWQPVQSFVTNPAWNESSEKEYDQVAARSYKDEEGNMVTVVMTWSRNGLQRAGHIQQLCYTSQGFNVTKPENVDVSLSSKTIPVTTFSATRMGGDVEDVYYWRVTGGRLLENIMENRFNNYRLSHRILKFKEIIGHIAGKIPANIMIRVSSLRKDSKIRSTIPIKYLYEYVPLLSPSDRLLILGE